MKEITIEANVNNLDEVQDFIANELKSLNCDKERYNDAAVITEEVFVNIASYAYQGDSGVVTISLEGTSDSVRLSFSDSGVPFNPLNVPEADITLPASERMIGGLGISLVKKLSDSIRYEYADGKNVLTVALNIRK